MTEADYVFEVAGAERIDEVRGLWLELHHHHRVIDASLSLVEDDELSWQRRRALYVERLRGGTAFLALASRERLVAAYAFVCIERGPDDRAKGGGDGDQYRRDKAVRASRPCTGRSCPLPVRKERASAAVRLAVCG
ncbi:MAG: hypothetical protein JOZ73_08380 [Solirubrobacterales bacterium]|nr:hypothetical protein [Solirubrobacterales bacterium]